MKIKTIWEKFCLFQRIWSELINEEKVCILELALLLAKEDAKQMSQEVIKVSTLFDSELLMCEKENVGFSDSVYLLATLAYSFLDSHDLNEVSLSDFVDLLREFNVKISALPFEENQIVNEVIIILLVNDCGIDKLIQGSEIVSLEKDKFWYLYNLFKDAFPCFEISTSLMLDFCNSISKQKGSDLSGGWFNKSLLNYSKENPEFAKEMVEIALSDSERLDIDTFYHLVIGIYQSSTSESKYVEQIASNLIQRRDEVSSQLGLSLLLELTLKYDYQIDTLLNDCTKISSPNSQILLSTATQVVTKIGIHFPDYIKKTSEILEELCSDDSQGYGLHGIAFALRSFSSESPEQRFAFLKMLIAVSIKNLGTISLIKDILLNFIYADECQLVWEVLELWVLAHKRDVTISNDDIFGLVLHELLKRESKFGTTELTKWFSSGNNFLVEEARCILVECKIEKFDLLVIKKFSSRQQYFVIEKLLIGHFSFRQLLTLLLHVLNNSPTLLADKHYVIYILSFICKMYPGKARTFISNFIAEDAINNNFKQLCQIVVEKVSKSEVDYKNSRGPVISELQGSHFRRQKYLEFFTKKNNQIIKTAMDSASTPLLNMIPKISIGRGDRWFFLNDINPESKDESKFSDPRQFSEFSQTMLVPLWGDIDPEGDAFSRYKRIVLELSDIEVKHE